MASLMLLPRGRDGWAMGTQDLASGMFPCPSGQERASPGTRGGGAGHPVGAGWPDLWSSGGWPTCWQFHYCVHILYKTPFSLFLWHRGAFQLTASPDAAGPELLNTEGEGGSGLVPRSMQRWWGRWPWCWGGGGGQGHWTLHL